jgi:hypothetical protein
MTGVIDANVMLGLDGNVDMLSARSKKEARIAKAQAAYLSLTVPQDSNRYTTWRVIAFAAPAIDVLHRNTKQQRT